MFLWAPCITALDCFNPSLIWRFRKPYFIVKWELEKQLSLLYTTRIYAPAHFLLLEGHSLFSQKFAHKREIPMQFFLTSVFHELQIPVLKVFFWEAAA